MTYQSFSNVYNKGRDMSYSRDFDIIIEKGKYITQGDIHFKIEYSNVNENKIKKYYESLTEKLIDCSKSLKKDLKDIEKCKDNLDDFFDLQIKNMKEEYNKALKRETPLLHFDDVQLFVEFGGKDILIARRNISSLEEKIVNNCLYLNQLFPGIQFNYDSNCSLRIRFNRSSDFNECLKFVCHYNLHDMNENVKISSFTKKYEESILYGTLKEINTNFPIDFEYKDIKILPIVDPMLSRELEPEDWKNKSEVIKKQFKLLKFQYFKNGLKTEEINGVGNYHIESSFNEEDFEKNNLPLPDNTCVYLKIIQLFN